MAQAVDYVFLGKAIPRIEGPDKLSGRATYSADVSLPGMLWGKTVRSPLPHARVVAIDTSRALRVPGVRAVLTAADFSNKRTGRRIKDHPVLSGDRVRFIGDKVAVVAAEDQDAAQEGALLVDVTYEDLPAVFDPIEAMASDAPIIHPDIRSYTGFPEYIPAEWRNVCAYQLIEHGDLAAGFAQADLVVENTFSTHLSHQAYLEPHACVVSTAGAGVEVWASNKTRFSLRQELAFLFDRPESEIVIHPTNIGGDFGSKGAPADVPAAYFLSRMTGRPVKMVLTSSEDLTGMAPRSPSVITLRSAVASDGRILAREARVIYNSGAYGGYRPSVLDGLLPGAGVSSGAYLIPASRAEGYMVYTNQVPCGYMRSPGQPQMIFAVEAHTDLIARELGMDRLDLRLRNLARSADGGESSVARLLRAAADGVGWATPKAPHVGRGLGIAQRNIGVGTGSTDLTLNPDGKITVVTAAPDNGTGTITAIVQMAAELWGVPLDRVTLVQGGTDALPIDVEAGASRMTNVAGKTLIAASDKLKEQLVPLAAKMLRSDTAEWAQGGWKGPDGSFVSLEDFAAEMLQPGDPRARVQLTLEVRRAPEKDCSAQAAEVQVDPETGEITILRLAAAQSVGTIINEIGHQGQIEGAVTQGLGFAMIEELKTEDGRVTTPHLGDYKLPTTRDIPELLTINLPVKGPGPFDAMAIGETPVVPTAAAIANAVADAIGAPMMHLPLTAESVLAALEGRNPSP
ncbi:MAG: Ald Xan dh protein [Chloroflexi bacterium]|nr:Ald Xan dh protein [Chloroflexota bacterium]